MVRIFRVALLASVALAQAPLAFEVASVKPATAPQRKGSMRGGPGTNDPGLITIASYPLERLILYAYDRQPYQYAGPEWMQSALFDISAKVPEGATRAEAREMLANLLRERFRMTLHYATQDRTVFDLVVAKGGPKMKPSAEAPPVQGAVFPPSNLTTGPDGFPDLPREYIRGMGAVTVEGRGGNKTVAAGESMAKLADHLAKHLGLPVTDRTGLSGAFDFSLIWVPDGSTTADPGPSLSEALQKNCGLRLDARKAPTDILVIDHAEKVPLGN